MEVHPILETNTIPNPNIWYVLSPEGDAGPCMRVGHTCTFLAGDSRRVLIIGGANPDGSFGDVYVLNLGSFPMAKCWIYPYRKKKEVFFYLMLKFMYYSCHATLLMYGCWNVLFSPTSEFPRLQQYSLLSSSLSSSPLTTTSSSSQSSSSPPPSSLSPLSLSSLSASLCHHYLLVSTERVPHPFPSACSEVGDVIFSAYFVFYM